ncbi:restriction endonuclease subunit S [Bacillus safensis]|uniref:restriction endonuclease subunit S n=1 Tax=Bacillus TaxID=1386 RepID=UPI00203AC08B|nr:restriction endonuclease subunit S [Bacillus safensis]MCM2984201.1 restriction endonuclease subunit S [Bacillus safensis]MCY7446079.1 restriction endonuclease subunit S [Bacillus safensis]MCY7458220.1 restriction endonuclease subunit S [Bacillus safensis]MEC0922865.1 restriction endonuclease subunit S [Bacillus safensis]MEC0995946.1 restriction endonuclease subunit S [Bacillus safensis]
MSKRKKTVDELLEEVLVPEEEQPYEVPTNWRWIKLKGINKDKKRTVVPSKFNEEIFELYSVPSYPEKSPEIIKGKEIGSSKQLVNNNDVLLCKINPRINRVWKVCNEKRKFRQLASTEWIVISENIVIYPNYLLYLLKSPYFRKLLTSNVSGVGGSLTRARPKEVENYPVIIPPLNEQKRIADKVERLLSKIEKAKQLIEEAKETFELRRAAILDKAFRGELTRKWREENGIDFIRKEVKISELISGLNQGWSPKCENYPSKDYQKWGVIKTTAIQHMDFIEEENKQLPVSLEPREKHELKAGDILITRAGPRVRVGVCCLIKRVRPRLLLCDKAYRFRANLGIVTPEFLVLALNTPEILGKINTMKTGISESGVNLTQNGFSAIELTIPPINEQKEIVRIVDNLLKNEQKAIGYCDVIEKIDSLKQSILSKAFRGELGTNDSSEENAIELIKEVLKEQVK